MAWGAMLRLARAVIRRHISVAGGAVVALGAVLRWLASRRSSVPPVRATGVAPNLLREQGNHIGS
jgi:hypothetical protein